MTANRDELILQLAKALAEPPKQPAPQPEKRGIDPLTAAAVLGIGVILLAFLSYPSTVGNGIPARQGGDSSVTTK